MIVIATGFIFFSPLSIVSTMVMWESSQWLVRDGGVLVKSLQESMDSCTSRRDITEILLNTVGKQPYNKSIIQQVVW